MRKLFPVLAFALAACSGSAHSGGHHDAAAAAAAGAGGAVDDAGSTGGGGYGGAGATGGTAGSGASAGAAGSGGAGEAGVSCNGTPCTGVCTPTGCLETITIYGGVAIALDDNNVYWSTGGSQVAAAPKAGLALGQLPTVLATLGSDLVDDIAVDKHNVYFTSHGFTSGGVHKVPKTGGASVLLGTSSLPKGIAVDATNVYWSDFTSINKVPIAGGASVMLSGGEPPGYGIAVDQGKVYWMDQAEVLEIPTAGGSESAIAPTNEGEEIAVRNGTVFYTTKDSIMRALGGSPVTTLASGQNHPVALAVDDTNVYWIDQVSGSFPNIVGSILEVPISGGTPTVLATGQANPTDIAVDQTSVYWIGLEGPIMKLTPK